MNGPDRWGKSMRLRLTVRNPCSQTFTYGGPSHIAIQHVPESSPALPLLCFSLTALLAMQFASKKSDQATAR